MPLTDWAVLLAGAAAIGWVNWYFLLAERRGGAPALGEDRGGGAGS